MPGTGSSGHTGGGADSPAFRSALPDRLENAGLTRGRAIAGSQCECTASRAHSRGSLPTEQLARPRQLSLAVTSAFAASSRVTDDIAQPR